MTFNPNGDSIEMVCDLDDTSNIILPAIEKMNLDDSDDQVVVNIKAELEFEGSSAESPVLTDSELEEFPMRATVIPNPEVEGSPKDSLVSSYSELEELPPPVIPIPGSGSSSKAVLKSPVAKNFKSGSSMNLTSHIILRQSGARMINNRLTFTKLENKSEVMNALAIKLGLSPALKFYDVSSLTKPDSLKNIPRPVYALLFYIPFTSTWESITRAKELAKPPYKGSGPDEPVIWFKQVIAGACGSMGLLHCLLNGLAHRYILPDTILSRLYKRSIPLGPDDRATMLYNDQNFEVAHQAIATLSNEASLVAKVQKSKRHFVAFVRGEDGSLWEMDGTRGGPIRREPILKEDEDLLTDDIMRLCMGGFVDTDSEEVTMCSCIALAKDPTEVVTLPLNSLHRGRSLVERSEGVQPRTFWDPAWYGSDHWTRE
ncbi:hypothetical protein EAE96_009092 [Botrytis aclada]|nr:hypothetical protein EAE96_009092 [Botrytis aclada]